MRISKLYLTLGLATLLANSGISKAQAEIDWISNVVSPMIKQVVSPALKKGTEYLINNWGNTNIKSLIQSSVPTISIPGPSSIETDTSTDASSSGWGSSSPEEPIR